ncbi:MAG: hypothetical protein HND52_09100 [Ignavibacteriae bacterium]|jgi:hypothetical protein|nr:hypothetical protein [Ignavibacteriota bacterium]NOG98106.1 hypothetical protein [Ignavibacteriota bacterium]
MKQYEQVINVMDENGGFATLGYLNENVDVSNWKTKTPFASIRRIVQDERFFFKIKPGLWALKNYSDLPKNILRLVEEEKYDLDKDKKYTHYYYQGIIAEIGKINQHQVYIPAQDKNKPYLNGKLQDVISISSIPQFTYQSILKSIKSIDVIWMNSRNFPNSVFEVEHSTKFKNSLCKYHELIDFKTNMIIVADERKRREFDSVISLQAFSKLKSRVIFCNYKSLDDYHLNPYKYSNFNNFLGRN